MNGRGYSSDMKRIERLKKFQTACNTRSNYRTSWIGIQASGEVALYSRIDFVDITTESYVKELRIYLARLIFSDKCFSVSH
jgi:hypothetical protein